LVRGYLKISTSKTQALKMPQPADGDDRPSHSGDRQELSAKPADWLPGNVGQGDDPREVDGDGDKDQPDEGGGRSHLSNKEVLPAGDGVGGHGASVGDCVDDFRTAVVEPGNIERRFSLSRCGL
jgi:hypothetical protein